MKQPISDTTGRGKMSAQAAVGYHNYEDEDSRKTKWRRPQKRPSKVKTLRHRYGR